MVLVGAISRVDASEIMSRDVNFMYRGANFMLVLVSISQVNGWLDSGPFLALERSCDLSSVYDDFMRLIVRALEESGAYRPSSLLGSRGSAFLVESGL